MAEQKAIYYGQVKLIPGIICDGYILSDQSAVMSERGTANLLGIRHRALQRLYKAWLLSEWTKVF